MSQNQSRVGYYQSMAEDNSTKHKSNRKRVYKYSQNQYSFKQNHPNKKHEIKHDIHDFSFENKYNQVDLSLVTPKKIIENKRIDYGRSTEEDNTKKKYLGKRLNQIDTLHDKISQLLGKVDNKAINQDLQKNQYRETYLKSQTARTNYQYQIKKQQKIRENKLKEKQNTKNSIKDGDKSSCKISKQKHDLSYNSEWQANPLSESILNFDKQKIAYNYSQQPIQKYKIDKNLKQKEKYIKLNKEEEDIDRKEKMIINNVELDLKINLIKNKIIENSPLPKVSNNSPKNNKQKILELFEPKLPKLTEQPSISKLANQLSRVIELDIILTKIRQSFQHWKDQSKWQVLRTELRLKGLYLQDKEIKDIFKISIHQKNPFGNKVQSFPLNGCRDLAKLYIETQRVWNDLQKSVAKDDLTKQHFEMAFIDLNKKGYISIEDLVCFVNVNSQKFYRSRDIAQLFKRFLKIQGKILQSNISDGIRYFTFMNKMCR